MMNANALSNELISWHAGSLASWLTKHIIYNVMKWIINRISRRQEYSEGAEKVVHVYFYILGRGDGSLPSCCFLLLLLLLLLLLFCLGFVRVRVLTLFFRAHFCPCRVVLRCTSKALRIASIIQFIAGIDESYYIDEPTKQIMYRYSWLTYKWIFSGNNKPALGRRMGRRSLLWHR